MGEERRMSPRIMSNIEIVFRESGSFIRSYMLNVSSGGIFIKTAQPLHLDAAISMRIQLPNDPEKMEIASRVVWTNAHSKTFPIGMGVQFIKLQPQHQEKIHAFVKEHETEIRKQSLF